MGYVKVLIVDDEEELCLLLGNMLAGMGYETVYAFSVAEGYKCYVREQPSIVFVDLNMPDGSGLSLIQQIRNTDPGAVVIVISAQDSDNERNAASKYGANHFIGKPLNRELIEEAIEVVQQRYS